MDTQGRGRLISRLVDHGATEVETRELFKQSQVIWQLAEGVEVSETCVALEEFMSNAARNAQSAINVIARMEGNEDHDLVAAMKKYVEDTGQSIKEVDDRLKEKESSLSALFSEIPDESEDEVSWRNLIGRRNVIAHKLLSVDNKQVYEEAKRDFASLHQLLSNIYFVPTLTNWENNKGFSVFLKPTIFHTLRPVTARDQKIRTGEALIFICEDIHEGFLSFRMGRSIDNKLLLASSRIGTFPFSIRKFNNPHLA